jgi:hypothetical protein
MMAARPTNRNNLTERGERFIETPLFRSVNCDCRVSLRPGDSLKRKAAPDEMERSPTVQAFGENMLFCCNLEKSKFLY